MKLIERIGYAIGVVVASVALALFISFGVWALVLVWSNIFE